MADELLPGPSTRSRRRRDLLECWWVLLLLPVGLLSWVAFLYMGLRAGRRRWLVYAVLYFAALWPVILLQQSFNALDLDDHRDAYSAYFLIAVWVVAGAHAWRLRRAFLDRVHELRWAPRDLAFERQIAADVAAEQPKLAKTVGIGRPDVPDAEHAGLVDVNGAPVDVLARLPGFDDAIARQVADTRPYSSLEELGSMLDLPAVVVEDLRGRTVFVRP